MQLVFFRKFNLTGFFLLTSIVFEIFRKNWKKSPSNAPPPPCSHPTSGELLVCYSGCAPLQFCQISKLHDFFFSFAIFEPSLTGLLKGIKNPKMTELKVFFITALNQPL